MCGNSLRSCLFIVLRHLSSSSSSPPPPPSSLHIISVSVCLSPTKLHFSLPTLVITFGASASFTTTNTNTFSIFVQQQQPSLYLSPPPSNPTTCKHRRQHKYLKLNPSADVVTSTTTHTATTIDYILGVSVFVLLFGSDLSDLVVLFICYRFLSLCRLLLFGSVFFVFLSQLCSCLLLFQ